MRPCHLPPARGSVTELSLPCSYLIGAADLCVDLDINSVEESVEAVRVVLVICDNPRICRTWADAAVGPSFPHRPTGLSLHPPNNPFAPPSLSLPCALLHPALEVTHLPTAFFNNTA